MNVIVSAGERVFFGGLLARIAEALEPDGSIILYATREIILEGRLTAHDVACGMWKDVLGKEARYGKKLAGASRITGVEAIHEYCGEKPPWE